MSKREREDSSERRRGEEEGEEGEFDSPRRSSSPLPSDDAAADNPHTSAASSKNEETTQIRKKQRVDEIGTAVDTSAASAPPRDASSSSSSSNSTSHSDEIRLLIDNNLVGIIIGKGGSNISNIRSTTHCFATVLKDGGAASASNAPSPAERVLSMKGTVENLARAVRMVIDLIETNLNSKDVKLSILVHKAAIGSIIGHAGSLVREMQASTHARIHVSTDTLGNSTDKTVDVSGKASDVHAAIERILKQLHDNPLKPGTRSIPFVPSVTPGGGPSSSGGPGGFSHPPPPPHHHHPYGHMPPHPPHVAPYPAPYPPMPGYGAYPPPPGGAPGYPPYPPPPAGYPGYPPNPYGMPPHDPYAISPPPVGYPPYGAPPPPPHHAGGNLSSSGGGGGGGGAGRATQSRMSDPNCTTQRIAIPAMCAGVVIGHGGSIVRELVKKSGAKISLNPQDPATPSERVVTIIGNPEQIQAAIFLIQKQVETFSGTK